MSEANGQHGLRPLQLRTKEELSDFLENIDTFSVVEILHVPAKGQTERTIGFYYGVSDDPEAPAKDQDAEAVYLTPYQDITKYIEPFITIPVGTIRMITPYGSRTPYEAACNTLQPKVPRRRTGRINLKSEFM